jgi:hypothetical protein
VRFVEVLLGENEAIATDFMKHYRSGALHVLDFRYRSFRDLGANSWPYYVFADRDGTVVFQTVSMGRGFADLVRFREAIDRVVAERPDEGEDRGKAAAGAAPSVVCKDGICVVQAAPGEKPPIRETNPSLAAGPDGSLWLAWCSDREGDANVYLRRCDPAKEGETLAVTRSLADDYAPAAAVGPDGRVWVAWASNRDGRYDIYLRSFDGQKGSAEMRVTESADDAMRPDVAVDRDGRVWVVYYKWNRNFGASRDRDVFARWFHDGDWSDEMLVSPDEPKIEDHTDPAIAADPKIGGRVWIAWSYDYHPSLFEKPENTDQPSVFARPVGVEGPIGDAIELVGTRGMALAAVDLWPSLAFDPDGSLWCAYDFAPLLRGERGVLAARRDRDGDGFAAPDRVRVTSGGFSYPCLAIASDGTRVVAWTEASEGAWAIRASRNDGTGWSEPRDVVAGPRDLRFPSIATLGGDFWIAFEEREGLASRIRCERIGF